MSSALADVHCYGFTIKLCGGSIMWVKLQQNTYRCAVCPFGLPLILAVIVMTGCARKRLKCSAGGLASGGVKAGSAAARITLNN
jgi:hypothetical protein